MDLSGPEYKSLSASEHLEYFNDKNRLIKSIMKFAYSVACKIHKGQHYFSLEEVESFAYFATVKAVHNWDPNKNCLPPYVETCIRRELSQELRNRCGIRLNSEYWHTLNIISSNRHLTLEEINEEFGISLKTLKVAKRLQKLFRTVDIRTCEVLERQKTNGPTYCLADIDTSLIKNEEDRNLIEKRFGLNGKSPHRQCDLARENNIVGWKITQRINRIATFLRAYYQKRYCLDCRKQLEAGRSPKKLFCNDKCKWRYYKKSGRPSKRSKKMCAGNCDG